jgi:TrmH family RNA methyltransferase
MLQTVSERSEPTSITSRRNPLVARFRDAAERGSNGLMLLDGAHLLSEALDAGVEVTDVAIANGAAERPELSALRRRVPHAVLASDIVIAAMSPARSPSGVVALARRPVEGTPGMFSRGTPLVVIAVDVQDPGNFGALLRSAEAGGATGVIATESGADPFGWKALRGAMGSAFRLPVARVSDGAAAVALARSHGLRVAAAIGRGGTPMSDADLTGPLALVVGGEGSGLLEALVTAADARITIPMTPPVESLNVSVAAALLVFEARRQRASHRDR